MRGYIRQRLVPANAVLAITGRVDATQAIALATKYFGWIPPGERIVRPSTPVDRRTAPVNASAADPNHRHIVAYRTNKRGADDELAVEVATRLVAESLAKAPNADVHYEVTHSGVGGEIRFVGTTPFTAEDIEKAVASALTDDAVRRAAAETQLELLVALEGLPFRADAISQGAEYERRLAVLKTLNADAVRSAARYWLAKTASVTVTATGGTQ